MPSHPIINFRTIQYADSWYENQNGMKRRLLPKVVTYHGGVIAYDTQRAYPYDEKYPSETMKDRVLRYGSQDVWTFVVKFTFTANKSKVFRGEKGKQMWKAWSEYIFNNK